jgi:hypothetical protein
VGKTHIAVAVAACRAGYSIYFTSLDDMVRNLKAAEAAGRLTSKLGSYLRPAVLVVDEVGYQPLERAEANLVFQVISKRYEKGSIILTSNKTFSEWGQVFGDEVLATAILDRLLHHCEVISINGPSYRLKNRIAAIKRDQDNAAYYFMWSTMSAWTSLSCSNQLPCWSRKRPPPRTTSRCETSGTTSSTTSGRSPWACWRNSGTLARSLWHFGRSSPKRLSSSGLSGARLGATGGAPKSATA